MTRPIRTLLLSTLYPSAARPLHGVFVETRLRELVKTGEVDTRVVAPVPWFPFRGARFGEYGAFAATPRHEVRSGIQVYHPRYFLPPKIGMNIAPDMIARAALPVIRELQRSGFDFDLIDAHYYYPDGVAASIVACALAKPFIVTARGTDLNLVPDYPLPRRRILDAAAAAAASIGVCRALMDRLAELGADPAKLHVLRNGVDLEMFSPLPQALARQRLGIEPEGRLLLSVGHLIERKGHHIAIAALPLLPADVRLVIAGAGAERARLEALAARLGVTPRVRFAGAVPQAELKWYYSAADALVLCSSREGWANVLLESMACGTPVIATDIWGAPEVVASREAGCLMAERSSAELVRAFGMLFARSPDRAATRRYAERFSWQATTLGQLDLMRGIAAGTQSACRAEAPVASIARPA